MKLLIALLMFVGSTSAESWMCKEGVKTGIRNGKAVIFNEEDYVIKIFKEFVLVNNFQSESTSVPYSNCKTNNNILTCFYSFDSGSAMLLILNKNLNRGTLYNSGSFISQKEQGDDNTTSEANCIKIDG